MEDEEIELEQSSKNISLKEDSSLASVFLNDDDLEAPPYNIEDFYWETGSSQKIARSSMFANFTVGVVMLNAIYIGVDSDYNDAQNIYEAHMLFQACSQFFCVYFTWELLVRFCAFKNKSDCMKDGWFKFDSFLVSTMILDTWILMPTLLIIGGSITIPTQPLRMLRLFKLTRMARLMKAFPELVTMIKGLVRSLRAISSSMILITLMVYVWAIMMHMCMKEEEEFNDWLWEEWLLSFSTMTSCIWTLLMGGTLMLDNAAPLMTELLFSGKFNYILAGVLFVLYALLSALLVLQMLIGVLCDVVSRVGSEQRDAAAIGLVKQELLEDLKQNDGGDGKISQQELMHVMNNSNSKALMKKLNINRSFLMEVQKVMYVKPGTQVPNKNILLLMFMCRGDNPTTVEAMSGGMLSIIHELYHIKRILEKDIVQLETTTERMEKDIMDFTTQTAQSTNI
jgi:voltage-gated sodium channel